MKRRHLIISKTIHVTILAPPTDVNGVQNLLAGCSVATRSLFTL